MKANELRIRNFILFDGKMYIAYPHDIEFLNENPDHKLYEPIPLTEEWMFKLGFEGYNPYVKKVGNVTFGYDTEKRFHLAFGNGVFNVVARKIEYVHQLQNLFFALTGEELTI